MVAWGRVETLSPALLFVDTGLAGAGIKLAESVIKEAGIKLEEAKAYEGAGGGGTLKIVPYTVHHLSFGDIQENNVAGLYDGPFPWENTFGFALAGMVGPKIGLGLARASAGSECSAARIHRRHLGVDQHGAALWPRPLWQTLGRRRPASPLEDHHLRRRAAL